jgi:hypothetical protein
VQHRLEVHRRDDGRWCWVLHGLCGRVLAIDGGEGFNDRAAAALAARQVLAGEYETVFEDDLELTVPAPGDSYGSH